MLVEDGQFVQEASSVTNADGTRPHHGTKLHLSNIAHTPPHTTPCQVTTARSSSAREPSATQRSITPQLPFCTGSLTLKHSLVRPCRHTQAPAFVGTHNIRSCRHTQHSHTLARVVTQGGALVCSPSKPSVQARIGFALRSQNTLKQLGARRSIPTARLRSL
jgi:hypothetical protein